MLEHRQAIDLEGLAELDFGVGDDLFQFGLASVQRQLPQIAAVQIHQIEGDHDDFGRLALELVLQHREVCGAVDGWYDDLSVEDRRRRLDVPGVVGDYLEPVRPIVAASGEDLDGLVGQVDLHAVAVEFDFVYPSLAVRHLCD